MNAAGQCETLFNRVDDLGAGIAALGDLLQFGQKEAYPDTLNGLGIVLRHLGASMRGLNTEFLGAPYDGIRAMEIKEAQAAARKESQAREAELIATVKEILKDAVPVTA